MENRTNLIEQQNRFDRRRFLRFAVGAGAAGLALSGCSNGNQTTPSLNGKGSKGTVTINFWNPSGDALGDPITKRMVEAYNTTQGPIDGVHVNQQSVSTANNSIKFTTVMSTPSCPDVVQTYGYNIVVDWAASGLVSNLDTLFSELELNKSTFFPFVGAMQKFGGHTWGLLQEWDADLLYWNKSIHNGAPPTTTDELDALSLRYTKFDATGKLTQVGLIPWSQGGFSSGGYGDWGPAWGASFYDSTEQKWTITKPQNQRFLQWYQKYVHMLGGRAKADALLSSVPSTYQTGDIFNYGKSAFAMEGEWFPKELTATAGPAAKKLHYGISPQVIQANGINSGQQCMIIGANLFLIPQRSQQKDAAAKFLRYMVSTNQLLDWSLPIGQGMPTPEAASSPELIKELPFMKLWNNAAAAGYFAPQPTSPSFSVFDTAMGVAINKLTTGAYDPAQALSYVDNRVSMAVQQFSQENPQWSGQ